MGRPAWLRWLVRDPGRFGAWFQRILVNGSRDRLRQRSRRPVVVLTQDRAVAGDETRAIDDHLDDRAFERLSPDHRVVLALRYYADLTVDEIADRVGVPAGTVKSRLHVAVERMRAAIGADDGKRITEPERSAAARLAGGARARAGPVVAARRTLRGYRKDASAARRARLRVGARPIGRGARRVIPSCPDPPARWRARHRVDRFAGADRGRAPGARARAPALGRLSPWTGRRLPRR